MNMAIKYFRVPLVSSCVSPYVSLVVCVVVGVVMCNFDIIVGVCVFSLLVNSSLRGLLG